MGTPSQRGQILLECAFALFFLAIMIAAVHRYSKTKEALFWKTIESSRIYKFKTYRTGELK